jgi:hypothetical protein
MRVAGWALFIVGMGAVGGMHALKVAQALWVGELFHKTRNLPGRTLQASVEPGEFWFWLAMDGMVALMLLAFFAISMSIVIKAKRASGRSWAGFLAGIARAPAPPGPPATSRAGNIIAKILLVPFVLIALILLYAVVTMR